MHYPTLYAFLLATIVPSATALTIRSDHRQETAEHLMEISRRSSGDTDEATLRSLEQLQDDLNGRGHGNEDDSNPYSLTWREDLGPDQDARNNDELDSVLDFDRRSDSNAGIKRRRRIAIDAFVRRSERPIPTGGFYRKDMESSSGYWDEDRQILLEDSGITSVKVDDPEKYGNDDMVFVGKDDDEEVIPDKYERLSRRAISAMISRRHTKRSLSR